MFKLMKISADQSREHISSQPEVGLSTG